jgi:hypothetical protein
VRRLAPIVACLVVPGLLAGCIGADGRRAELLLQQSAAAQQSVRSEGLVIRFTMDADGHSGGVTMDGGAYLKGPNAGDFFLRGTGTGELTMSGEATNFAVVRRAGVVTVSAAGHTENMPVSEADAKFGSDSVNVPKFLDVARYVKSVSVDETSLGSRPADRIVGKLDTSALFESVAGFGTQALKAAGVHFGDIRAVLFVPRDTHLVEVMFADMTITAGGHKGHMHMSVAVNGVNRPVVFPTL